MALVAKTKNCLQPDAENKSKSVKDHAPSISDVTVAKTAQYAENCRQKRNATYANIVKDALRGTWNSQRKFNTHQQEQQRHYQR